MLPCLEGICFVTEANVANGKKPLIRFLNTCKNIFDFANKVSYNTKMGDGV
jgi:hypothetical protein